LGWFVLWNFEFVSDFVLRISDLFGPAVLDFYSGLQDEGIGNRKPGIVTWFFNPNAAWGSKLARPRAGRPCHENAVRSASG
jgi:hypothetical protein